MADLAAVFIDGGYLMKVLKEEFGSPGVDFKKLAEEMAGDHDIFRAYYYNCMPHQGTTPTVEEQQRYTILPSRGRRIPMAGSASERSAGCARATRARSVLRTRCAKNASPT